MAKTDRTSEGVRPRTYQLHLWLDDEDQQSLKRLEDHYGESASGVIRPLLRGACVRLPSSPKPKQP